MRQSKLFTKLELTAPKDEVALNAKLLDERGRYVSENARIVDEKIFYFVEENEIELPDTQLRQLLIRQIK